MTAAGRPTTAAITFAIPYYDNLEYLREAIASVVAQTRGDWNVVVVDDAGPAPADAVIAAFGDHRITLHRNDHNLGLAGNWNECLRLATAPWVTLLHADDQLHPEYAAEVLAATERDPDLAAVFCDAAVIDATGAPARSLPESVKRLARRPKTNHDVCGDDDLAAILSNNYVMCPTICYRTSIAVEHPFADRWKMVMDLDHTAELLLTGQRLHAVRRPLYLYRRHSANQTSSLTASAVRFEEEIALYRELADQAAARGWRRTERAARRRTMVRVHLVFQIGADLVGRNRSAARRKLRLLTSDLGIGIGRSRPQ